ncbi:unnamed protein product [Paramecium sonneborni]|uniref:Uncharacterized protein n=1 Tax=Paramecium sonneborni TaxID=65129 RepID=A0A8S1RR03_9CILI|nr:unnamed protein product [Paramecium sonneborni]
MCNPRLIPCLLRNWIREKPIQQKNEVTLQFSFLVLRLYIEFISQLKDLIEELRMYQQDSLIIILNRKQIVAGLILDNQILIFVILQDKIQQL